MEHPQRWRAVRGLLRSCYAEVLPLEAFVRRLQGRIRAGGEAVPLLQDGDPSRYRTLVDQCLVGRTAGCKALPPRLILEQVSSQNDVIARVIQRICEKKKRNVLAFGYDLVNEHTWQLPCMPNIYSYLPNNTTETIRLNVLWEIILSRVGDDVMMYLLEHCGLFILVPPSCCYQICGQPIYGLPLRNKTPSPKFFRMRCPGQTHSVLSGYLQRRFYCRQYSKKANWRKWNSRKQRWSKTHEVLDCNYRQSLMVWRAARQNSKMNKLVTRASDYLESQQRPNQCPSLTTSLLKRKWKGQCEISAKRMRIMQTEKEQEKETRNPVPTQLILDVDRVGVNAYGGCVRSRSMDGLTLVKSLPLSSELRAQTSDVPCSAFDNQGFLECDKELQLDTENKTLCGSTTETKSNIRPPKLETGSSGAPSTLVVAAENATAGIDLKVCTPKSTRDFSNNVPVMRIEMRSLLYSHRQLKECLPKSFVLNRLKGYPSGGQRLIETIFFSSKIPKQPGSSSLLSCNKRKKRLPKRYWQMRGVFQELLWNHAKCPYLVVLKKNCPIWVAKRERIGRGAQGYTQKSHGERSLSRTQQASATENCLRSELGGLSPFQETPGVPNRQNGIVPPSPQETELQIPQDSPSTGFTMFLKQHSSHWQVYAFVRECLERVIPAALWGSNHNKCRFYKNVKKIISLGKFDVFSLQELMWKMRVNNCTWLRLTKECGHFVPASEHHFRQVLMSKFLYWLMDSYVAELLRSFFYITETLFQKNLLFFFRKTVWSKLQSMGVRNHLAKVQLRALLKEEIKTLQQKKCVPLASKLRFIPKPNGLRPVVKLNSVVGAETFCKKSRDRKVQYFNTQLKNLFSVLNYERMKNPILLGSSVFGKDDIYTIWKKFVLKVLESNAEMPRFYFVKADVTGAYDTIPHDKLVEVVLRALAPDKKATYRIRRYAVIKRTRNGLIRRYYRRDVSASQEFMPNMKQFVCNLQECTSLRNAVIVEQSVSLKESNSSLYEFFLQLIQNNILKIEDRYYVQCCGIPQGSILSTLLCNLCYGDMESKLLRGVQKDGTLAMGIPEYGFVINPAKTVVNFRVDEDIPGCLEFKQLPARCVIPWCGLLIGTQTLEVYCDYSSYACTTIRSSLCFNFNSKAGVNMRNKLLSVLQLKCHSLFVDLQINSLRTVCINVYKILLLQAYRFHACVLQMPFNQQIKNNPGFFLRVISDITSCCFSVLKAKNADFYSSAGNAAPLTYEAAQWLSYHAFIIKLGNHSVIYKCLLVPLKQCKIRLLRQIPEATMKLLKEVTEPSLHEDFKAILD